MAIGLILVVAFVAVFALVGAPAWAPALSEMKYEHNKKKLRKQLEAKEAAKPKRPKMSLMASHVLDEFYKLPKDNRPFTAEELTQSLVALDVKFGIEKVNGHFVSRDSYGFIGKFTTDCNESPSSYPSSYRNRRYPHNCPYQAYKDFLSGMKDIHAALEKQKKALALSAVQHELDAVPNLTKALREESKIVNTVTDELC